MEVIGACRNPLHRLGNGAQSAALARGKFRHLGITEMASDDYEHRMLQRAVRDAVWEVMVCEFNLMNHHARHTLFPYTMANQIGTLLMFAVRSIFSNPARLKVTMRQLVDTGQIPTWLAETSRPLDFLVHANGASSVIDAAYRFVRHEPGVHGVLFGTSDPSHLRQNIDSLLKPPLPEADRQRLSTLFGHLIGVGFELPDRSKARA
jgi:aryl-alcohol dehydrogenase-like predicted oxidoreductase